MSLPLSTSRELERLIDELSPHCGCDEIIMSGKDYDLIVSRLAVIRKIAVTDERELGSWRLAHAARSGRAVVDRLAAEQFDGLARDGDAKIVRPNFGRKP